MIEMHQIKALGQRIARDFPVEKVILFGSYAHGNPTEDSDVDLLVIMPFKGRSCRKAVEILCRTRPGFPVDLLPRRPGDSVRRYADGAPLIREAFDHGIVLYERHG